MVARTYIKSGSFTDNGSSGTVQNINEDNLIDAGLLTKEQVRSYGFTWEFGRWTRELQENAAPVPFYGYRVYNISSLTKPVDDLAATFNTNESGELVIDLSWSDPGTVTKPVASYALYLCQEDGSRSKVADLPAGTTEYTYDSLDGRT